MSVLVFPDAALACSAAATMTAAALLEKPSLVRGLDPDATMGPVFRSLSAMTENGLISWDRAKPFLLKEYVSGPVLLKDEFLAAFSESVPCLKSILEVPPGASTDWARDCEAFEEKIRNAGGLDLALATIDREGAVLFNFPDSDLAPVTHVEAHGGQRSVTLGLGTLMSARRLIVLATGREKATAAAQMIKGSIDCTLPASLLRFHTSATFILDEDAAEHLK